jgi:hypothetical protein
LSWYNKQLDDRPLLTKSITSGTIGAFGDCVCQFLSTGSGKELEQTSNHDWHRTARFFIMGSLWVAPITNHWYTVLSTRIFPGQKRTISLVLKRLVVDQFMFAPIFCPSFMAVLWFLEGQKNISTIRQELIAVTPDVIKANWALWIPAMTINFSVVPLKYQVLFGTYHMSFSVVVQRC